jgi:hypothetical protein
MKLSLNQTKELLERVEKQLLEKKINLQEDGMFYTTSNDPHKGKTSSEVAAENTKAGAGEKAERIKASLPGKAEDAIKDTPKNEMPQEILPILMKIAKKEEITKEEMIETIKKIKLSGNIRYDIIQPIQSYAKVVFGIKL